MQRIGLSIVIGALALTACGPGNVVEATVNGTEIMTEDVEALRFEVTDFDQSAQGFATNLSVAIQLAAIEQKMDADPDFQPTEDEIDTEVRTIVLAAGFLDLESYLVQTNLSEAALRKLARQSLARQHVDELLAPTIEQPTVEEAEQELEDNPDLWVSEVCASHILVTTSVEAEAALERINAGEDFGVVAAEISNDPVSAANGGSLPCADPIGYGSQLGPGFAEATVTAPIGEVTGPVQGEFGSHLILVESRAPTPVEEVQEALAVIRTNEAVEDWFDEAVRSAVVTVNEARGTWVTDPIPQVLPLPQLG